MQVGNATCFYSVLKKMGLVFSNESDSYVAPDMTILLNI